MTDPSTTTPANTDPDRPLRTVVADDSVLLRDGIVRLLGDSGFDVVAAVGDGDALLDAVTEHEPDLCVVDVRMPPTHTDEGLRAAIEIRRRSPSTAVLVLSQYVEEHYAGELLAGDVSGVGYLLKDRVIDVEDFLVALRRVADGGSAVDAEVVSQILSRSQRSSELEHLTPREREVLELMAEGLSNGAIASRLVVSAGAVEKHISNVFSKLGLQPEDGANRRVMAVLAYLRADRPVSHSRFLSGCPRRISFVRWYRHVPAASSDATETGARHGKGLDDRNDHLSGRQGRRNGGGADADGHGRAATNRGSRSTRTTEARTTRSRSSP